MFRKAELRKLAVDFLHDVVAGYLGDDAGGGNRERDRIALYDAVVRVGKIAERKAVDEAVVGRIAEAFDRAAHGEVGGLQDVDSVDFLVVGSRDRPDDVRVGGEVVVEFAAGRSAELF